jgi:hypothetical protein
MANKDKESSPASSNTQMLGPENNPNLAPEQPMQSTPQAQSQPQVSAGTAQPQDYDTISKLLMSLGSGLAAAGGQPGVGGNILDFVKSTKLNNQTKGIFGFDPMTGKVSLQANVPANAEVRNLADTTSKEVAVGLKESQRQDRLEQNAISRLSSIRGDTSIARIENQRDAAITAYNRIAELETQGEKGLNPIDYTDILGQLYRARTGVAPTEQILKDIRQNTLQGNFAKAYTFATGKQAPTSTEDITKSLKKMAESFGKQADKLHEGYMKPHLIKPKDLDEERWQPIISTSRGTSFEQGTAEYRGKSPQAQGQSSGWSQDKESRYQELLKKRGQ